MSTLDSLIAYVPAKHYRPASRVIMALLFCFVLWASLAGIDEVSVAKGEVVPQEKIQTIQHLEGGIIEEILVKEGSRVKEGEPLIQLNLTSTASSKDELQANYEGMLLKRERLKAEAEGSESLTFSENLSGFRPALIETEHQAFEGRKAKLASSLQLLEEQVNQRKLDIEQLKTEKASIERNLSVLREKLRISQDLVKDKLTSKLDHLQLKSEVEELDGKLNIINVAIPRAEAAYSESIEREKVEKLNFRNEAVQELSELEVSIARAKEMLAKAEDQVLRTTIKSPINGVVKALKTHTIGGVVQPGEAIMEIVPESGNLVIEARLNPKDIGFVKEGQKALVKLLTYDYSRFGGLEGAVISISPDSHTDPKTGEMYFEVIIRTDRNFLGKSAESFPITAGMEATADILTGRKTVMEYLLKPVAKIREEAFRER